MLGITASRGQGLQGLALGLVSLGITAVIGMRVVSEIGSQMTANSLEANAATDTISAIADIPGWMPIIVIAAVAAVVLGYVLGMFNGSGKQQ